MNKLPSWVGGVRFRRLRFPRIRRPSVGASLPRRQYERPLIAILLAITFLILMWPALRGPVVLWSDSRIDLDWARRGVGIFEPPPPAPPGEDAAHPVKPTYLVFLRTAMALSPFEDRRSIVVLQSLLLFLSASAAALFLARRRGFLAGLGFLALLLLSLRVRNGASAVMPETITTVLLLPCAVALIEPPRRSWAFGLLGPLSAALFWVRPNAGAAGLALLMLRLALAKRFRAIALLAVSFAIPLLTVWAATRPSQGGDAMRGLSFSILEGSADDYWRPSLQLAPREIERRTGFEEMRRAVTNWRRTLAARGPDARRQLSWRAFHGLLGTEFYDSRWSRIYQRLHSHATILSPFLILASVSLLLILPFGGKERSFNLAPAVLLLILVLQNLVLGSNPRYVSPFLPLLFLLAAAALQSVVTRRPRRLWLAPAVFALLVLLVSRQPGIADVQWGQVEAAGVRLRQTIPKGALPRTGPATLHLRIAPAALPSGAHLEVIAPGGQRLYDSQKDSLRHRPAITMGLPDWLLESNSSTAVTLELVSSGQYGQFDSLLFPIVPPPWSAPAVRSGSTDLSPATGIPRGSLDWWTHSGLDHIAPETDSAARDPRRQVAR